MDSIPDETLSCFPDSNLKSRHRTCPPTNLQYNTKISVAQLIECKRREKRILSRPLKASLQARIEYGEDLFDSIESFLDHHGMFIVSASPTITPRKLNASARVKSQQCYCANEVGEELSSPCIIKEVCLFKSDSTNLPASETTERPFLGKIAGSSLFQRRKKAETLEGVLTVSRSENDL